MDGTSTTVGGFYTGTCSGHDADDVIFYFKEDGRSTWTNQEIYDLLDPSEDNLKYVYHNFMWEHCDGKTPTDFTQDSDYKTDDENYRPDRRSLEEREEHVKRLLKH